MRDFDIPFQFRSQYISKIKKIREEADKRKKDFAPSILSFEKVSILIPRHFGFCFGVQNAVEKAYEILEKYPDKKIYLISEIIHNPEVNGELQESGLKFIQNTKGEQLIDWNEIHSGDIVITPAFGTTPEIEKILKEKKIDVEKFDTTCPFVERVWNKGEALGKEGYTIIIHGNPHHEETRATLARISQYTPAVIVSNKKEADILKAFILKSALDKHDWGVFFKWKASEGFNFRKDLDRIAVVNQTTMLASETQNISNFLKEVMIEKFGTEQIDDHFGSTRDTLCYATYDNQTATKKMLEEKIDLAFVIGGYNSSNTKHIAELMTEKCKTFYINTEKNLKDDLSLEHYNFKDDKLEYQNQGYLPSKEHITIALSSGASCPDATVERVMLKLLSFINPQANLNKAINDLAKQYGL